MQKQKFSITKYRSVAIFLCSLLITLVLGISARLLVSYRVYKAVTISTTKIYTLWSEFFSQCAVPSVAYPPDLAMRAQLHSKSDFSDIVLNMSYTPNDSKIAAKLYANCVDGVSKELYAFVDKSSAGFSFGENDNDFYTIPSATLTQGVGLIASLVNHQSYYADIDKLNDLYTMLTSLRNNSCFINDRIKEKLFSVVCSAKVSALGNNEYKFKIKTSDLKDISDAIAPHLFQNFFEDCKPNSCFTLIIHMSKQNLDLVECITPSISGRVYIAGINFTNEFRGIDFHFSELASSQSIIDFNTKLDNKQLFCELDYNSGVFNISALYDSARAEIYSHISAGQYQNFVARGRVLKNSYVLTAVCADSAEDKVINLKFLQDDVSDKKTFTNIITKKMTFKEIMKLQRELRFFHSLYIK